MAVTVDIQSYILPSSDGTSSLCLICIQECAIVQVVRSTGEMVDHMQISNEGILHIRVIETPTKLKKLSDKLDNTIIPLGIEFIENREIIPKESLLCEG